jgi:hypothetical protein
MSFKALEISAELADELIKRLPSLIVTQAFDTNGDPVITCAADATPATGEKVIVIRTKAISWALAKDVLGLTSTVYTPHVIQVCTEKNYAGASDNIADILTPVELLPALLTVGKRGCRVEWFETANGTVPSATAIDSGTATAIYEAELYWGMLASQ